MSLDDLQHEDTQREEIRHNAGAHRDPLTDAPGAHPLGTGIGAALGGAATGAIAGAVAGPVGALVGAAAGALVGGLAGKAVAEVADPTLAVDPLYEHNYWREHFVRRPYVVSGATFADYGPAYQYGIDAYQRFPGQEFDHVEVLLGNQWVSVRGASQLDWAVAREAARDAWMRVRA